MEWKAFFIIFKGLSLKQIKRIFLEGEILTLRSLITYIHSTAFLTFLITKTSSDQFETQPFAKMFLYFDILTTWPILNLGSLLPISWIESIYVFDLHQQASV